MLLTNKLEKKVYVGGVFDLAVEQPQLFRNYTKLIIIIIKKGWQCKAGRERLTLCQYEDPNPTTPTHRMKEEKRKTAGDKK